MERSDIMSWPELSRLQGVMGGAHQQLYVQYWHMLVN